MFENFSKNFRIFRKLFVRSVFLKHFPEIGGAETIRLVRKSLNFELSSRFFDRSKIFICLGSQNSYEPLSETSLFAFIF